MGFSLLAKNKTKVLSLWYLRENKEEKASAVAYESNSYYKQ